MKRAKGVSGVCRVCGCTDERACIGGCSWVDKEQTLCSRCADAMIVLVDEFKNVILSDKPLGPLNIEAVVLVTGDGTATSDKHLRNTWEARLEKAARHYQIASAKIIAKRQ